MSGLYQKLYPQVILHMKNYLQPECSNVKEKQSLYRPGGAQRVPGN
jgi:hypothetical protein